MTDPGPWDEGQVDALRARIAELEDAVGTLREALELLREGQCSCALLARVEQAEADRDRAVAALDRLRIAAAEVYREAEYAIQRGTVGMKLAQATDKLGAALAEGK